MSEFSMVSSSVVVLVVSLRVVVSRGEEGECGSDRQTMFDSAIVAMRGFLGAGGADACC
jgi:hypothetical protein